MRIAVLGLGRMGAPMARNLAEVGHQVTVYNRTHARALELASTGARAVATIAEAVAGTQVALTMVTGDAAEEALTFGSEGLLAHLPTGAIHLCMSTIGVETSRKLASAHEEKGQGYIAAPVFGRPGGASSRHLWIVVGGPEAQITRCLTIFDALARGLTRIGPIPEVAHAAKLGGNLLTLAMVEGLAEVLAFGEKAGLPSADYLRLLNAAIFKSPLLDSYGGLMVRHTFEPADLCLDQAAKDTQLALAASDCFEAALPMADLLHRRLEGAEGKGFGAQDLSVLFRACRMDAGLEEAPPTRAEDAFMPLPSEPRCEEPPIVSMPLLEPAPAPIPGGEPEAKAKPEPVLAPNPTPAPSEMVSEEKVEPLLPASTPAGGEAKVSETQPPVSGEEPLKLGDPMATYPAESGGQRVILDLDRTSHFEMIDRQVWAWHQEKRYHTPWRSLEEVEGAFRHILLLRIQRHVLLQPETVRALRPLFGGRAKAKVGENLELEVSRAAAGRLREVLGL